MKKFFFLAATAALALSSCSSDEELVPSTDLNGDVAVSFDTYLMREGRATALTTTASIKDNCFGVFGYQQGLEAIEDYTSSNIAPNFFHNQWVKWNTEKTEWYYDAVGNIGTKYWPNTPGHMLSFYAYAPYMALSTEYGVSNPRLILNGDYNGPALYYKMPTNLTQGIDLCWGQEYGKTIAPVNKEKPAITENVKFNLKHALSRYGFNVQVWSDNMTDNYPDNTLHNANGDRNDDLKKGTTIIINSVKLVGNFATEGTLSLYDGKWDAQIAKTNEYELKENFNTTVTEGIDLGDAKGEIPLLQDASTYALLIPGSRFKIVIDYDVKTLDVNMPGNYVVTNNVITSEKTWTAQSGVATDFHLNLGMTTVKFDATVTPWNNADKVEVDLPNNTLEQVVAATVTPDVKPLTIDADFLGESSSIPTPVVGKYYYDLHDKKLYGGAVNGASETVWAAPQVGNYMANDIIYSYDGTNQTRKQAPRWIKVNSDHDFYLLVDGEYKGIANYTTATYPTVEALAQANPAPGIYKIGDTYYYYVQQ